MSRRKLWETLSERFDPYAYVVPAWRADRPHSPAARISRELDSPFAHDARFLVVGTIGTGKTTELLRIREARELGEFVVFLDLARYFERLGSIDGLQHVAQWEVCFLAAVAIAGAYSERYQDLPKHLLEDLEEAYRAAAKAADVDAPATVDLAKAGKTLLSVGAAIATAAGAGPIAAIAAGAAGAAEVLNWNVPIGRSRKRVPDDDAQVMTVFDRVNAVIGEIQSRGKPILLVIDGLDRIRDSAHAAELFVESDLIARLACRMVVCGPYALRHGLAAAAASRFQVMTLVNEPVLDQRAPAQHGPGIRFFRDLFDRRTRDLAEPAFISSAELDRLAYSSGGRARDFVKMLRMVVRRAWMDDAPMLTSDVVDAAMTEERLLVETGLHRGHIDVLRVVRDDPQHRLPDAPVVGELLVNSKLLPYPDGSEWFYPHPLLTTFLA